MRGVAGGLPGGYIPIVRTNNRVGKVLLTKTSHNILVCAVDSDVRVCGYPVDSDNISSRHTKIHMLLFRYCIKIRVPADIVDYI